MRNDDRNEGQASGRIEALLEEPYHVIDLLPRQVPAAGAGRFFPVERYYLYGPRRQELRRAFLDVLLKLHCYCGFLVFRDEEDEGEIDPSPEMLEEWMLGDRASLTVLLGDGEALLSAVPESTCMTVYGASEELLELLRQLAASAGLFLWKPEQQEPGSVL